MKARLQVGLIKLSDPRVIRVALIALAVILAAVGDHSIALACPGGANGGCSGG